MKTKAMTLFKQRNALFYALMALLALVFSGAGHAQDASTIGIIQRVSSPEEEGTYIKRGELLLNIAPFMAVEQGDEIIIEREEDWVTVSLQGGRPQRVSYPGGLLAVEDDRAGTAVGRYFRGLLDSLYKSKDLGTTNHRTRGFPPQAVGFSFAAKGLRYGTAQIEGGEREIMIRWHSIYAATTLILTNSETSVFELTKIDEEASSLKMPEHVYVPGETYKVLVTFENGKTLAGSFRVVDALPSQLPNVSDLGENLAIKHTLKAMALIDVDPHLWSLEADQVLGKLDAEAVDVEDLALRFSILSGLKAEEMLKAKN